LLEICKFGLLLTESKMNFILRILLIRSLCGLLIFTLTGLSNAQALKVGQEYQGGIIFFIDESGKHELIAARTT